MVDQFSFTIRVVDRVTGAVSLLAGQPGVQGTQDGVGPNATFALPHRIWGEGRRVYITDANSIRSINLDTADVITLAGIAGQPGAVTEPLNRTVRAPRVSFDRYSAIVAYSGLAPGLAGWYQVTVQVPALKL